MKVTRLEAFYYIDVRIDIWVLISGKKEKVLRGNLNPDSKHLFAKGDHNNKPLARVSIHLIHILNAAIYLHSLLHKNWLGLVLSHSGFK